MTDNPVVAMTVEYANCILSREVRLLLRSILDMTLSHPLVRLQSQSFEKYGVYHPIIATTPRTTLTQSGNKTVSSFTILENCVQTND